MNSFDADLTARLDALRAAGLGRELRRVDSPAGRHLRIGGAELRNFSSNDYLGLATHPALVEAAARAARDFGAGSTASRLVCGSLGVHHELEERLAAFKGTAAALSFSSGYAAAVGTISALLESDDILIIDKRVHACCVDAARLCGAKLRVFAHNDLDDLGHLLRWAAQRAPGRDGRMGRVLVVTESVFSMDGDTAPLRELVDLKDRFGAWLMLDEAHAVGVHGPGRRGLAEELGVADRVEIQMGTLGKAVGAAGGYIAGSRALVDLLLNRARSFVFSTAPVPAAAAAARAGLEIIDSPEGGGRAARLWERIDQARTALPWPGGRPPATRSAILPWMVGDEGAAVELSGRLRSAGAFVPAIRYPTVPRGAARLRITLSAAHEAEDVEWLAAALTTAQEPR